MLHNSCSYFTHIRELAAHQAHASEHAAHRAGTMQGTCMHNRRTRSCVYGGKKEQTCAAHAHTYLRSRCAQNTKDARHDSAQHVHAQWRACQVASACRARARTCLRWCSTHNTNDARRNAAHQAHVRLCISQGHAHYTRARSRTCTRPHMSPQTQHT